MNRNEELKMLAVWTLLLLAAFAAYVAVVVVRG